MEKFEISWAKEVSNRVTSILLFAGNDLFKSGLGSVYSVWSVEEKHSVTYMVREYEDGTE